MTDAFRCDGCDEFFGAEEQFLDLDLDTEAVRGAEITLDDIKPAFEVVWNGAHGDFCVDCGQQVLEALVDLFVDDEPSTAENTDASETTTTEGGPTDMDPEDDEATDEDVEAAVDGHDELPEFEELLDESEGESGDVQEDIAEDSDDGQDDVYGSGLSPTAERVLSVLREHGELTSGEIQAKTDRAQGTVSRTLSELKEKDRVESRKDPDDGRRQLHSLTDEPDDEHRVGDPIDEDSPGAQEAEADGGVATEPEGDALPPGVSPQDIRDAVDAVRDRQSSGKPYLGDVADELNVREARARLFCHEVGVYSDVIDASGYRGGA